MEQVRPPSPAAANPELDSGEADLGLTPREADAPPAAEVPTDRSIPMGIAVPEDAAPATAPAEDAGEVEDDVSQKKPKPLTGLLTGGQGKGPRGAVLGDYRVVRKIGAGGFGSVYLARQVSLGRDVALKVLARHHAARPDFVERFYREARTMARLEHPNIVRGYAVGEDQGHHYFAMEFVDGDSMGTWLARLGRIGVGDTLQLALQIAYALEYAHELNLVHRDIKPDNILISSKGVVKVTDLGLAKAMDEDLSLTNTGAGFGTPYYMAPEQARNAKYVDRRSDIYALGNVMYRFLTGLLPFQGETAVELILAKEHGTYPPARRHNPEVPERLDLILYKMMARKPDTRYQNCVSLIQDLESLGLANPTLEFLATDTDAFQISSGPVSPQAATQQVRIDPAASSYSPAAGLPEVWYVRLRTPEGKRVVRTYSTSQLQEEIKKPDFDLGAQASHDPKGDFRPLASIVEFEQSVRSRQSKLVRADADRRPSKLQRLYDQIGDEDHPTPPELRPKPPVTSSGLGYGLLFAAIGVGICLLFMLIYFFKN